MKPTGSTSQRNNTSGELSSALVIIGLSVVGLLLMLYNRPPRQTVGTATSCNDNGGIRGATEPDSVKVNSSAGVNCTPSSGFQ